MAGYTKEQMRAARRANLYSYVLKYHADSFVKAGNSIKFKNNMSISIKNGYSGYYDFSNDEKGNSVDFLVRHLGYELCDAVHALVSNAVDVDVSYIDYVQIDNQKEFHFPAPKQGKYKKLFAYLNSRQISNATISLLLNKKLIYQDEHDNIVFACAEHDWGEIRGTSTYYEQRCKRMEKCIRYEAQEYKYCKHMKTCKEYKKSSFKGMVANSREDGYWCFSETNIDVKDIYICEASIDAISLYELHKLSGKKENNIYVSIGGAGKQKTIDRIKKMPSSKHKIILAVDNDKAGRECLERNPECEFIVPQNKDWNEDLTKFRLSFHSRTD